MATSPRSECALFAGSSRRATKHVAWSAAGRSNQLKVGGLPKNLRAQRAHVLTGWLNNVPVHARTKAAWHFKPLSRRFLDYCQLKYSQTLFTDQHHVGNPM